MKPILPDELIARSHNSSADNRVALRALFPEAVRDGELDFDVIRALCGSDQQTGDAEKYGLHWRGKRRALQTALTPSTGTLRPCVEDSVAWETTGNVFIEGDNLEVLKLLQKSYAGRVKMIYIDPPYNTGSDFVYPDDYHDNLRNYLQLTGQIDNEGRRVSSNTEVSGRYHTAWLNMMYPRLKLARSLLREDGVLFVSIDDHEEHNLKALLAEIFGEENFVGTFVWKRRTGAMDSVNNVSTDHEYVVCYTRSSLALNGELRTFEKYANPDNDPRGPWIADNLSAAKPGGDTYYEIRDPATGYEYYPPAGRYWPYSRATMQSKIAEGRIIFPGRPNGSPLLKRFQREAKSLVQPVSTWIMPVSSGDSGNGFVQSLRSGLTSEGTKTIKELFEEKVFTYAKPLSLLQALIRQATQPRGGDIVLDFFAGSATTGHAVMAQNSEDGGDRRFILVQLQEPLDASADDQRVAAEMCDRLGRPRSISELAKERLRRAGKWIGAEEPLMRRDVGFRVFRLASSNIRVWAPDANALADSLFAHTDQIVQGRTEQDVLYELLLKLGLDVTTSVEQASIHGKPVYAVGGGVLIVCLAPAVANDDVEALAIGISAWCDQLKPVGEVQIVVRDTVFVDDVSKANFVAVLKQHGINNIRSL